MEILFETPANPVATDPDRHLSLDSTIDEDLFRDIDSDLQCDFVCTRDRWALRDLISYLYGERWIISGSPVGT